MLHHQPLQFAVFRHHDDALLYRVRRAFQRQHLAIQQHLTRTRRIGTGNRPHQLGASRADKTGDTKDFAGANAEADVAEGIGRAGQPLDLQHHLVLRFRQRREQALQRAADHAFNDGTHRRRAIGKFMHPLAIAQHDDAVGDLFDLFHAVGNIDDADTLGAQLAHLLEQRLRFRAAKCRRRLIEDQKFRVQRQRLGDFDQLLVGGGKTGHLAGGGNVEIEARQLLLGSAHHLGAVDNAVLHQPAADEDIFSDGKLRQKLQLLMDEHDALVDRLARRCRLVRLSKPCHLALGRLTRTGDDT
ncbi:hypothetical protein D3C80_509430 [compost metagenome]